MADEKKKASQRKNKEKNEEPRAHKGFVVKGEDENDQGDSEQKVKAEDGSEVTLVSTKDDRFDVKLEEKGKKSEKKLSDVKKSMQDEAKKEKRVMWFHRFRLFFTQTMDDRGVNAIKGLFVFSRIVNYGFNLFTIGIIGLLIVWTVAEIMSARIYDVAFGIRIGAAVILLIAVTWIHEKIE